MNQIDDWKLKGVNLLSEFLKSRKNSNCLLELEELLLSSDETCVLAMFQIVIDLFSKVFSMSVLSTSSISGINADYKSWLLGRYEDFISHLLSYLDHDNNEIQVSSLRTLLSLVKLESDSPRKDEKEKQNFPFPLFKRIVSCLASDIFNKQKLIIVFQEYTKYPDVKLYLLKAIDQILSSCEKVTECFLENCFLLLYSVKFPKKFDDGACTETFAYRLDSDQQFQLKEKPFRKSFTSVWNCLLNYQLSPVFLRKALSALNENVLPHLQNPCLMTDFLSNAYNKGGVLSLLALKGLYILMDQYNLEYPDFFVKLYSLLDRNTINGKFSSRFFDLADLFLSSTHLPAHIVAAFVKKLAHLSLFSTTDNILKMLRLISNMLVNHPSVGLLLHNPDGEEYCQDPFSIDAIDPAESNAMKSSLWEIKTLHNHVNPDVSSKAKMLTSAHPKLVLDISQISGTSLQDLYRKSRKRKLDNVSLAISKPPVKKKMNSS